MRNYPKFPDIQPPSFPIDISYEDIAIRSKKENGDYKLRKKFSRSRKTFTVKWNAMSRQDYQLLEDFFVNVTSTDVEEFVWTYPTVIYKNLPSDIFNGKDFVVRFISLNAKAVEHSYFVVNMVIMESFAADMILTPIIGEPDTRDLILYYIDVKRNLFSYVFVDVKRNLFPHVIPNVVDIIIDVVIFVYSGGYRAPVVPVLGDDVHGYIRLNGEYNSSNNIPQSDWLINSYTTLYSGSENYNGHLIIDSEITKDNELLIVTDGLYRKCSSVTYNNHLWETYVITQQYLDEDGQTTVEPHHWVIHHVEPVVGKQVILGVDSKYDVNTPVVVYKNNEQIAEIDLSNYVNDVIAECKKCENELMSQNPDISNAVNFSYQPAPPSVDHGFGKNSNSFIAFTYARVSSFRVQPNGDWDAIIETAAYGYCFMYFLYDGTILANSASSSPSKPYIVDSMSIDDIKSMYSALNYIDVLINKGNYSPMFNFTPHSSYPYYDGIHYDTVSVPSYEEVLDKFLYYKEELKFKFYVWDPVIFSASAVFHVHNGEIIDKINANSGGGVEVQNLGWDHTRDFHGQVLDVTTPPRLNQDVNCNYTCRLSSDWSYNLKGDVKLYGHGAVVNGLCSNKDSVIVDFSKAGLKDSYEIICSPYYPMPLNVENDTTITPLTASNHSAINLFLYTENVVSLFECNGLDLQHITYADIPDEMKMYLPIWLHLSRNSSDGFYRINADYFSKGDGSNKLAVYGLHGDFLCYEYNDKIHYLSDNSKNFRFRIFFPIKN